MTKFRFLVQIITFAACAAFAPTPAGAQAAAEDPAAAVATPVASSATATSEPAAAEPAATETGADEPSAPPSEPATAPAASAEPSAAEGGAEAPGAEAAEAVPAVELDGATYRVRLRDLEQRVDELKEQIRRSHTRLSLLSDTILAGATGGARAQVEFQNDLSGAWHLVEAVFVLDGAVQYKKTDDTGVLAKQRTIPIFNGSIPTGDHTLQVMLKLRGHGFGVFSYLRGMEASLKSDHSFTLAPGKVLQLDVTAWEKGGPTTPVEEQPDIRFNAKIRDATEIAQPVQSSSEKPSAEAASKSSGVAPAAAGKASVGTSPQTK